jgi:glycyl-tRNA synthetase beta chain
VVYEGRFDPEFLAVPQECLILTMQQNQKYFALADRAGRLVPRFLVVSNVETAEPGAIVQGNERVLRARLADARFFFEEDRKRRLSDRIEDLGRRTYQARLGSELDRVHRIGAVATELCRAIGRDDLVEEVLEVARLCKTDLTTGMVGEFPELQGTMGGHYARLEGLRPAVAEAIEDHYKPVGASEEMPRSDLGALVGVADRLHQLVGIVGVGEKATGAADPYGLRRAAIAVLRIVQARGWHLSLAAAVERTLDALSGVRLSADRAVVAAQVNDFLRGRLRALWADGFEGDLVDAVLAAGFDDVVDARSRLEALSSIKARPDFVPLAVAFKRVANIREKAGEGAAAAVDRSLVAAGAEAALLDEVERVEAEVAGLRRTRDYAAVLRAVASLKPAVDRTFDEVLVMADDPAVRANRLGLMKRVSDLFADVADFRKIQAEAPPAGAAGDRGS